MIKKYGEKAANEIIEYSFTNSNDPTKEVIPPQFASKLMPPSPPQNNNSVHQKLMQIQKYNEAMREMNSNNRMIPQNINKFSPAYSRIIAAKPKASTSATIRLGGVYR
jgi:hypothetical protein